MTRFPFFVFLAFLLSLLLTTSQSYAQLVPSSPTTGANSESAESAEQTSLDDLIRILENEEARNSLIQSLKAAAYRSPEEAGGSEAEEAPRTLPGEIAEWTRMLIGTLIATWRDIATSLASASRLLGGASDIDLPKILEAVLPVGLVAIAVFVILAASRIVKNPIFRRMSDAAEHSGPLNKLFLIIMSSVIDALSVIIAWGVGTVAATVFSGGRPGINQTLFLNAFLFIETIKVILAGFVAPNYPKLRLTPFSDRQASYWYFWFSRIISILGYTFMFLAPILQRSSGQSAADALRFTVVILSLILAISLILKNRGVVRDRLKRAKERGDKTVGAYVNAFLGQIWWLLAIGFVLSLFIVYVRSPQDGLAFMTTATLKSIAAMAIGGLIVSILSRAIARGIPVPQYAKDRLPLLERRVNSFIPNALTVMRLVVVVVVILVVLEAWGLLDFSAWLETAAGQQLVGGLVGAGIVLTLGVAVYIAVSSWVEYRLNPNYGTVPTARERTLLALFRNAFTITMVVVVAMLVLSQIGIDIAPLLAGAGVVGLAIGFGAQKFVQDIITGAFIQIQNAMNEGDVVEVNGISGTVEQLTVRSVGLRTVDGAWYLIPFSSVDQVGNFSKDFAYYVADVGVAYRENIDDVKAMMVDAFDELKTTAVQDDLLGDFEVWGVQELGNSSVVVRGRVMTKPGTQWGIGRAYREIVKRMADERGIEIPFPNMTVWFGQDRQGAAPPLRIAERETDSEPAGQGAIETTAKRPPGREAEGDYGTTDRLGQLVPPAEDDIDSAGPGRG